jgi:thioredoxin 1
MIKELTSENFVETIKGKGKILVDFSASWCGPCRMLKPILTKVAGEGYNIAIFDVDTDANITNQYNIRGIPALILFEDGIEKTRYTGMATEETIKKFFA